MHSLRDFGMPKTHDAKTTRQGRNEKFVEQSERFFRRFVLGRCRNTLCISKRPSAEITEKDPLGSVNLSLNTCPIEKGGGGESSPPHGLPFRYERRHCCGCPLLFCAYNQADRVLRPFARRRARTLRPLDVAILLRKP